MSELISYVNQDGSVTVPVDLVLQRLGEQISEQSIKIATLQCTNTALQNEIGKLNLQVEQAQKMVNTMIKEKAELKKASASQ